MYAFWGGGGNIMYFFFLFTLVIDGDLVVGSHHITLNGPPVAPPPMAFCTMLTVTQFAQANGVTSQTPCKIENITVGSDNILVFSN